MTAAVQAPAPLLADDPALRARDVLLDEAAMRAVFASRLGADGPLAIVDVSRVRSKYRPGESLRVLFRVEGDEGGWLVSGRMRAGGAHALFREALSSVRPSPPLRSVVHLADLDTVVWTFPNDRRVPFHTREAIAQIAAGATGIAAPRVEVAGYAPERAVIYRILHPESDVALAYVKTYAPGDGVHAGRVLDGLTRQLRTSAADLHVPRLMGQAGDLLVFDALPGRHLHDLPAADLEAACRSLGRAVATLHTVRGLELPAADPFGPSRVRDAATILGNTRPDLGRFVRLLASRLDAGRPHAADPAVIHGDLNSRNWLACDGHVALFDLDQLAVGDPAVDLGGALAWMRMRMLAGDWSPGLEARLLDALLGGYGEVRRVPEPRTLLWHRAAALFVDRATRAVTRVRVHELARLVATLEAAWCDLEDIGDL